MTTRQDSSSPLIRQLCQVPPLAHHPTCSCFDHHLIRVAGIPLCLGCTSTAAGLILGSTLLLLSAASLQRPGWPSLILIGICLYLPTLAQPFFQTRLFKIASRTCLGIAVVLLWFGGMVLVPTDVLGITLRLAFLAVFFSVIVLTWVYRRLYTPDPKVRCGSACFPFCVDNLGNHRPTLESARTSECHGDKLLAVALLDQLSSSSLGAAQNPSDEAEAAVKGRCKVR
jgi:hypothetical protein